jgi:hypothetical protein
MLLGMRMLHAHAEEHAGEPRQTQAAAERSADRLDDPDPRR